MDRTYAAHLVKITTSEVVEEAVKEWESLKLRTPVLSEISYQESIELNFYELEERKKDLQEDYLDELRVHNQAIEDFFAYLNDQVSEHLQNDDLYSAAYLSILIAEKYQRELGLYKVASSAAHLAYQYFTQHKKNVIEGFNYLSSYDIVNLCHKKDLPLPGSKEAQDRIDEFYQQHTPVLSQQQSIEFLEFIFNKDKTSEEYIQHQKYIKQKSDVLYLNTPIEKLATNMRQSIISDLTKLERKAWKLWVITLRKSEGYLSKEEIQQLLDLQKIIIKEISVKDMILLQEILCDPNKVKSRKIKKTQKKTLQQLKSFTGNHFDFEGNFKSVEERLAEKANSKHYSNFRY